MDILSSINLSHVLKYPLCLTFNTVVGNIRGRIHFTIWEVDIDIRWGKDRTATDPDVGMLKLSKSVTGIVFIDYVFINYYNK